jgi:multiple sugar transport system permease protein
MTGGGPYYATLFLPVLAFEEAFDRLRFGVGSVIVLVMVLFTLGLLALLFVTFQEWGYEEG